MSGLPASSIKPLQLIQNAAARLILMSQKECKKEWRTSHLSLSIYTGYNSCLHKIQGINVCLQNHLWLCTPLPKSLLQTYVPLEASILQMNVALLCQSQRGTNHFSQTFYINCSFLVEWPAQLIRTAESLDIFKNQLKTHLFIFIWPSNSSTLDSLFTKKINK